MGIYDREYYRNSRRTFLGTINDTGQICKWLIIINAVVFLLQVVTLPRGGMSAGPITDFLVLDTGLVFSGQVWRLLTYSFLHAPEMLLHILFNMLFLWWFGRDLEEMYGAREFLTFYLIAAFLGGVTFTLLAGYTSWVGAGDLTTISRRCVGASGAVTAVMVVYACHFPKRTILLFFVLPVPIWLFVAFQVFQDAFAFANDPRGLRSRTAVTVHLAGALFGFLYYRFQWRVSSLWSSWNLQVRQRRRPRLRIYHDEPPAEPESPLSSSNLDEQLEAKLDAILEKIKVSGQESLTESERQILQRASEIYKQRRSSKEGV